eukprot:354510-Chlamydomonas_euryale.AAC.4
MSCHDSRPANGCTRCRIDTCDGDTCGGTPKGQGLRSGAAAPAPSVQANPPATSAGQKPRAGTVAQAVVGGKDARGASQCEGHSAGALAVIPAAHASPLLLQAARAPVQETPVQQLQALQDREARLADARRAQRVHHHTQVWIKEPHGGQYVKARGEPKCKSMQALPWRAISRALCEPTTKNRTVRVDDWDSAVWLAGAFHKEQGYSAVSSSSYPAT